MIMYKFDIGGGGGGDSQPLESLKQPSPREKLIYALNVRKCKSRGIHHVIYI